jgi:hypothetical protein
MALYVQEHIGRYVATDGEEGHDWQGTQTLILTTTWRRSGLQRVHPFDLWPPRRRLSGRGFQGWGAAAPRLVSQPGRAAPSRRPRIWLTALRLRRLSEPHLRPRRHQPGRRRRRSVQRLPVTSRAVQRRAVASPWRARQPPALTSATRAPTASPSSCTAAQLSPRSRLSQICPSAKPAKRRPSVARSA